MTAQENSDFSHQIYKNDPILLKSYVGKEIKITMKDEDVYHGIAYTIDPVSESIILLQRIRTTAYSMKIIFGHWIKNIEVISDKERDMPELFLPSSANFSQATTTKRKDTIKKLLIENRLPITEENDSLKIDDFLIIDPPYYPDNCISTNSIILSRVRDILKRGNN